MNFLSLAHKAIKATQNTPQRATLYLYRFLLLTCRPDVFACIALGQHQGSMTVIKKRFVKKDYSKQNSILLRLRQNCYPNDNDTNKVDLNT